MSQMEPPTKPAPASLFQVYLRLRPPPSPLVQLTQQSLYPLLTAPERFLTVEPPSEDSPDGVSTHITIHPPSDSRKRAVEKFAFHRIFEESASQLDLFKGSGAVPLVEGVLKEGRDGLLATLGVTGSGKSHTILGSKSQRGLTQLSMDLLYRSLHGQILDPATSPSLLSSLTTADASEAHILPASGFLDGIYGDAPQERNASRAPTPMTVGRDSTFSVNQHRTGGLYKQWSILGLDARSSIRMSCIQDLKTDPSTPCLNIDRPAQAEDTLPSKLPFWTISRNTRTKAKSRFCKLLQEPCSTPSVPRRNVPHRLSTFPQFPDITSVIVPINDDTDYSILVSMYEVYNDRIFDLLCYSRNPKDLRRRPLLFKSTETSPDRKLVAGLRKVVCASYEEALTVLEIGLTERRVAGTGSNSVSSRSHGFFCIEVRKRQKRSPLGLWSGAQLTIVDLAGSERARNAKTAGATLAEAGKINESLMYLGQCLQMQSDCQDGAKPSIVPFRQCKLTELLFSNSFPSSSYQSTSHLSHHRNPQKAVMIVTADPIGDFNATSQMLRYSALAREVTVPRIPSVSSTILAGTYGGSGNHKHQITISGRSSPDDTVADLEVASGEIARLNDEVDMLNIRLYEEQGRRMEAEEELQKAEERTDEIERQVREECWGEMEKKLEEEKRRWIGAWSEEADRVDEHLDRKLEVLSRSIQIHEDIPETAESRISELENENVILQRRIETLERQLQCQTPTRDRINRSQMYGLKDDLDDGPIYKLKEMHLNESPPLTKMKTPLKKVRKLTARKWDLGDENELESP